MAASSPPAQHHERRLGFSYEASANLFFRELANGVREAAGALGVSVLVRESFQSVERQRADCAELLAEGVAALLLAPVDSGAMGPVFAAAQDHGVPVFTVDRAATGCPAISHVTSDNVKGGSLAADLLGSLLAEGAEVAVVNLPGVSSVAERVKSFAETLARQGRSRLVADVSGGGDRQHARAVAAELLRAHPGLGGFFAINDVSALGVVDAIRDARREEDVVVVGYDATPRGCEEILRGGPLRGDVAQSPARLGQTVVDLWAKHTSGGVVPPLVRIPVELITRENVERFTGADKLLRIRRGDVRVAGERIVFFPVRGYQLMLNEIHAANPDLLRHIVYRSGFTLGESIAEQVRALYPDPHDRLFVLLEDLTRGGFGAFELLSLDLAAGQAEVRGQDLFETAIAPGLTWARSPRCVDVYCSGRLAGYLTAIAGRPAVCEEIACQARGDPYCHFALTVTQP